MTFYLKNLEKKNKLKTKKREGRKKVKDNKKFIMPY